MLRFARRLLELLLAACFLAALAIGLLSWQLQRGAIPLQRLMPLIESGLADLAPGVTLGLTHAALTAGNAHEAFGVKFDGVTLLNAANRVPLATVDGLQLGFSWFSLLTASFVPSRIDAVHPVLDAVRFADGRIGLNLKSAAQADGKPRAVGRDLIRFLSRSPYAFEAITLRDAQIHVADADKNTVLDMQNGQLRLGRQGDHFTGTVSTLLHGPNGEQLLDGVLNHDPDRNIMQLTLTARDVRLDHWQSVVPSWPKDLSLDLRLDVVSTLTLDRDLKLLTANWQITGQAGEIRYPPFLLIALPVTQLLVEGMYDVKDSRLTLDKILLDTGTAQLQATAARHVLADHTQIIVSARAAQVPISDLDQLWPQGLGLHARDWVTSHLRDGVADKATLDLSVRQNGDGQTQIDKLAGRIDFHGITVDYLPPMPAVTQAEGHADYTQQRFAIHVDQAKLTDSAVSNTDIVMDGLQDAHSHLALTATTDGPLRDALRVVAAQPLAYLQHMGLTPEQFTGHGQIDLTLNFPLKADLDIDDVQVTANAKLNALAITKAIKDLDVTADALDLIVDNEKLQVTGDVKLADAPAHLDWQEYFGDAAPVITHMLINGRITPAVLRGLRLPLGQYLDGAIPAKIDLGRAHDKTQTVTIDADLTPAHLAITELNLDKAVGADGHAALTLTTAPDNSTAISKLAVTWPGVGIGDGQVRLNADSSLHSATLSNARIGRSRADIAVAPLPNDGLRVTVRGDTLDLTGYWSSLKKDDVAKDATAPKPLSLALMLNTIYLVPDQPLTHVKADLNLLGSELLTGTLQAQADDKAALTLKQSRNPDNSRHLNLTMANAGEILRALDITDSVRGGDLAYDAQSTPQQPTQLDGMLTMTDFTLVGAPILARLINALSPRGLLQLLNAQGLKFERLQSRVSLPDPDTIRLRDGKLTGASLGMSFAGRYHRDTEQLNLKGTLVPLEGLNKFASKIPLLGRILTGLKGEGLIAATYKINGSAADPQVNVNPLSVLTPGILRSIFFERGDDQ